MKGDMFRNTTALLSEEYKAKLFVIARMLLHAVRKVKNCRRIRTRNMHSPNGLASKREDQKRLVLNQVLIKKLKSS